MTPPNNYPSSVEATWNPYSVPSVPSGEYAPTAYFHGHHCPHFGGWDIHGTPVTCVQYPVTLPSMYPPHPVYAPYGYYTAPIPAFVVTPPTSQTQFEASHLSTSFNSAGSVSSGVSPDRKRGGKKGRIPCGQCFEERIKYSGKVRAFKGRLHCYTGANWRLGSVLNLFHPPGRIVETIKNQNGSRFIQQKLLTADKEEIQLIFDETMKDFDGTCFAHASFPVCL